MSPSCLFGLLLVSYGWPGAFKHGDRARVALKEVFSEDGMSESVQYFFAKGKKPRGFSLLISPGPFLRSVSG